MPLGSFCFTPSGRPDCGVPDLGGPILPVARQIDRKSRLSESLNLKNDSEIHVRACESTWARKSSHTKTEPVLRPAKGRYTMNNPLLETFATKVTAKSRITFGDVCRIRRDVLPDGIASREEAEALLRMDRLIGRADSSWVEWLTNAIVEFAVWSERPTGHIDTEAAAWLAQELMRQGPLTKAGRRI